MTNEEILYGKFKMEVDSYLLNIIKNKESFNDTAFKTPKIILSERKFDVDKILEEHKKFREDFENYQSEIFERIQSGEDIESVKISLKEKGYNTFDILDKEIESDEHLKKERERVTENITVLGRLVRIIRDGIRF